MARLFQRLALEDYSHSNLDAAEDMFHLNFGHVPSKAWTYSHAMEESADGKVFKEIEHVIYARLTDFSQLQKAASSELNEQWEIRVAQTDKNAGTGCLRVRKTQSKGAEAYYVLTTKVKMNESGDKLELSQPTNEDAFKMFKFLSEHGMLKERFHFPVEGTELVWEVDMFPKGDGTYHEWCKIDLEVTDREAPLPELPMQFEEVILPKGFGNVSDEEHEAKVRALYDSVFLRKNEFKALADEQAANRQQEPDANSTQSSDNPPENTQTPENKDDNQQE